MAKKKTKRTKRTKRMTAAERVLKARLKNLYDEKYNTRVASIESLYFARRQEFQQAQENFEATVRGLQAAFAVVGKDVAILMQRIEQLEKKIVLTVRG